ncbi:flavin reductase family protein [Ktedonobacter racemifer]|uniref:Flavin reductase domain protein FMN-binding n=1 Tax=Ktedonobacter racemifer DSM 44963 TaxID=485913 RepID=D6U2Q4_KTERA|nr:flavin reductase family protein [Ktedonobacter racemifer]EFH81018.1 flavin reductase domain protein FMN-binding [Ktedonobacter racemifer DSM 44963]
MGLSTESAAQQHSGLVDPERFRSVMSHFASGVTIITTRHEGIDYGLTANAVSSLSRNPPMLLICVNKASNTHKAIAQSQVFAVNILQEHQSKEAQEFAQSQPNKFSGMRFWYGELGAPLLSDALATIECRVTEEITGGTHSVFLAEVQSAQAIEGMPLTYYRGKMGRLTDLRRQNAMSLWREMQWEDAS